MAFAPGKVILLGEHAVVFGKQGLACALDRGVCATATAAGERSLRLEPFGIAVNETDLAEPSSPIARAAAALFDAYGAHDPVAVVATAEIAAEAGLGCSAAMAVAIVRALDDHRNLSRTAESLAQIAMAWERVFHGNASGIDVEVSARGGLVVFRRGAPAEAVLARHPLSLVVVESGTRASTKEMLDLVARQHERAPERVTRVMDGIDALLGSARLAIEHGRLAELGALLDMNHSLLASLMLSTERIETLRGIARDAGALGSKLTGAGGGGAVLVLAADSEHAARLLKRFRDAGAEAFVTLAGAA